MNSKRFNALDTHLPVKVRLSDLSRSRNVVVKLPPPRLKFRGSDTDGYGPVNAIGMTSVPGGSSNVIAGYGNSSYGSGIYGESIEMFKDFVLSLKEHDEILCTAIMEAIDLVFMENDHV